MDHIRITVMSGAQDGEVFEFHKTPIILGRHPSDDVYLQYDTRVSRHHARITKENKTYFIEDVGPERTGSTNGTYLIDLDNAINETKITAKTPLSSGTHFGLGTVWLKFEYKSDQQYYTEVILNQFEEAHRKLSQEDMKNLCIKIESILKELEEIVTYQDFFNVLNEIMNTISDTQKVPPFEPIEEEPAAIDNIISIKGSIQIGLKKKIDELKCEKNDDK